MAHPMLPENSYLPHIVVTLVAQGILQHFQQHKLHFAFCGEFAIHTYGVNRGTLREIDIMLISKDGDISKLKQSIADCHNSHFIYEPSSGALQYHRSTEWSPVLIYLIVSDRHPLQNLHMVSGFPLVPFAFLLLQKLKEWASSNPDSLKATRKTVMEMLRHYRRNSNKQYCAPMRAFDPVLHAESDGRVARFFTSHPSYRPEWQRMGFLHDPLSTGADHISMPSTSHPADTSQTEIARSRSVPQLEVFSSVTREALTPTLAIRHPHSTTAESQLRPASSTKSQQESKAFVPCPPHLLGLLNTWNSNPGKGDTSKQITTFLKDVRKGKKPLFPGFRPNIDLESNARAMRFWNANKAYFPEWQKMGFLLGYNRYEVPPPPTLASSTTGETAPTKERGKIKAKKVTFSEIQRSAAQMTVDILREHQLPCAIFGSMACKLYGNPRFPNDIDILVLPPPELASTTQEKIKDILVERSPDHFVLRAARDPTATYRVLHFRPAVDIPISLRKSCKVDILLPGVMHLPALSPSAIIICYELPVIPFPVLLLQKLQGWDDHRLATEERYRKKAPVDVKDFSWLLGSSGVGKFMTAGPAENLWSDRQLFSEEFERLSKERVKSFCGVFPSWSNTWSKLGFEVL